jgi:UV DNA damage repair endonuclease
MKKKIRIQYCTVFFNLKFKIAQKRKTVPFFRFEKTLLSKKKTKKLDSLKIFNLINFGPLYRARRWS